VFVLFRLFFRIDSRFPRAGHTEASVDLCKLSNLSPVAAICEITKPNGTMARLSDLQILANQYGLELIAIEDIITYRKVVEGAN